MGIFLFLLIGTVILNIKPSDPDTVISELYSAIDLAEEQGNYRCCIEPACTMCYLGHWGFEKGTCFCDDAIKSGDFDKVCPECKSGIEQGACSSTIEEGCELDENIYGGTNEENI